MFSYRTSLCKVRVKPGIHSLFTQRTLRRATTSAFAKVQGESIWLPPQTTEDQYWSKVAIWNGVSTSTFQSHRWQLMNTVQKPSQLFDFLETVLPNTVPSLAKSPRRDYHLSTCTKDEFIGGVRTAIALAPMSIRLTPHILSIIDWQDPLHDPVRRQFIPWAQDQHQAEDHPMLKLDSLNESDDSPVKGLVHRYPEKVLFLATSICPVYCRFCTRSYAVGTETATVNKQRFLPTPKHWEPKFQYLEATPSVRDVVVSGGDSYLLEPWQLTYIGERLLSIPHIKRIRFASKGLSVAPGRILDPDDGWASSLINLDQKARSMGKSIALHTHFNHPQEITWITAQAAQKLYQAGLTIRNQTVLLNGINNSVETMSQLVRSLAEINIIPYYVYQCDMVKGIEELRTPLYEILELEAQIRGTIAGFMTPSFIVDLPGGGGKRLAASFKTYDRDLGISRFEAPSVKGGATVYEYYDPLWSLGSSQRAEVKRISEERQRSDKLATAAH